MGLQALREEEDVSQVREKSSADVYSSFEVPLHSFVIRAPVSDPLLSWTFKLNLDWSDRPSIPFEEKCPVL